MKKPRIIIGKADHARLEQMANGLFDANPARAEELFAELDRARVVAQDKVPSETVQIGSTLEYETEGGQTRRVTLVHPSDADIAEGRISVLTPIGTALIGLSVGQAIDFVANDGRRHRLTVRAVEDLAAHAAA